MRRLTVLILLVMPTVVFAKDRIAYIEFFGYEGIDVTAIRASLPFREGDALPPKFEEQARASVLRILGRGRAKAAGGEGLARTLSMNPAES